MRTDATYEVFDADKQTAITIVTGFNIAETAAGVARVLFRDGGAAGAIIADIHLAASQSVGESFTWPLTLSTGGIYVDVVSGAVRGAVYGR